MANTISAVLPSLYAALDVVSRELIGIIPAVQRNTSMERAAVGQVVTIPVVPPATGGNVTPGSVPPDDGDAIIGTQAVVISKSKYSPVRWNGEEQLALGPAGTYNTILADQFAQAMRWLANQIEADGGVAAANGASRAYGTAGAPPFGTAGDLTDFAGMNKILDENGAPQFNRRMILGAAARYNLEGKQSVGGADETAGPGLTTQDAGRESADDLEPRLVDVVQHEFVDRQGGCIGAQSFDELRRVGAAAADDGDLEARHH